MVSSTKSLSKFLGLLVALMIALAACGGGDDADTAADGDAGDGEAAAADLALVSDGVLTVCTDVPYPPMEFEDPDAEGGYTGFDIELMRAIAEDNGLGLAVATPGWDAITSGLAMEAGDCDISAASITITEEREENIDFSDPYFTAEQSLMSLEDNGASTLADMATVGVQSGTTGELYLNDNAGDVEVVAFSEIADMYLALEAGDVEGVVTDLVGNQGYIDENGGAKVVETYATDEVYGLAVKEEGSEDLLAAVNASLAKLDSDGTYDSIFGDWFSG